jgi:hypothetical protein
VLGELDLDAPAIDDLVTDGVAVTGSRRTGA